MKMWREEKMRMKGEERHESRKKTSRGRGGKSDKGERYKKGGGGGGREKMGLDRERDYMGIRRRERS